MAIATRKIATAKKQQGSPLTSSSSSSSLSSSPLVKALPIINQNNNNGIGNINSNINNNVINGGYQGVSNNIGSNNGNSSCHNSIKLFFVLVISGLVVHSILLANPIFCAYSTAFEQEQIDGGQSLIQLQHYQQQSNNDLQLRGTHISIQELEEAFLKRDGLQRMTKDQLTWYQGPNGPKYTVLVTGGAGFIGMHTCLQLQQLGMKPIAYDNVNDYYSTELKELRIQQLTDHQIPFIRGDVCNATLLQDTIQQHNVTRIIHLAAQAGVRYSIERPLEYTRNNIDCFVTLFEIVQQQQQQKNYSTTTKLPIIYASSSSVYGKNTNIPFRETDVVNTPESLYAATKQSNELIAKTYHSLYNISSIGLRFFTVYGPFGRPDMAPFLFTDKVSTQETIQVFNYGQSQRDYTYVTDIVQGVIASLYVVNGTITPQVMNLGRGKPIPLSGFIQVVQDSVGQSANLHSVPMQKGDVPMTYADISKARYALAYNPTMTIEEGIPKFVKWYQEYNGGQYRMVNSKKKQ